MRQSTGDCVIECAANSDSSVDEQAFATRATKMLGAALVAGDLRSVTHWGRMSHQVETGPSRQFPDGPKLPHGCQLAFLGNGLGGLSMQILPAILRSAAVADCLTLWRKTISYTT